MPKLPTEKIKSTGVA